MKFSVFLACCAASVSTVFGATEFVRPDVRKDFADHQVLNINFEVLNDNVRSLLADHGADYYGTHSAGVEVRVSRDAAKKIADAGVKFEDSTEKWLNQFEENYNDPNFFCTDGTHECAGRDLQSFYGSYQTLEAIYARIANLRAASSVPSSTQVIGQSYEGRDMTMVYIGDQTKPLVYYQCNVHAREWLTPMYCTHMIEQLLAGHDLLSKFAFAIMPSVNPDGYAYSIAGNTNWRKTRKPNSGSSCVGTDGNRNWNDHHCGQGASTNKCDETYCGVTPFDQPETANIAAWADTVSSRLFSFADIHSYGGYWMSPYGWTYSYPPAADFDRMETCFTAAKNAVKAVNGQNFIIGSSANAIYIAAGGSDDWFYSAHGVVYAFSVELRGTSFQPASSNIIPSNNEIFAGMVASLNCAYDIEFNSAPVGAPTIPPTWTCNSNYYGANDGCDCECGAPDPDCADSTQQVYNCDGGVCVNGVCQVGMPTPYPVAPVTTPAPVTPAPVATSTPAPVAFPSLPPASWICPTAYYNSQDGCDCSYCGAVDPDCALSGQTLYGCGTSGTGCNLNTNTCITGRSKAGVQAETKAALKKAAEKMP